MKRIGVWRKGLFSGLLALCLVLGLFAGAPTAFAAVDSTLSGTGGSTTVGMTEVAPTTTEVSANDGCAVIQPLASSTVTLGVTSTTDTVALIQTALQNALDAAASGDTVTVDGTYVNNTPVSTAGTLTLSIPTGRTLRWQAVYEGTVNIADFIAVSGSGTLDVASGGSIVNNSASNGINVSDNTRSGKWGSGALESISKQLQGELPGLRGFSTTNMKYMRIFFEQWVSVFEPNRQLPTDDFQEETAIIQIRQLPTDELKEEELNAYRVGFTHQTEILSKCNILEERWYYIKKCASEFWSVDTLKYHIKANDYSKYGALPNNFELTLPDKKHASRAVQSFKSEYFLDFINIELEEVKERLTIGIAQEEYDIMFEKSIT